MCASLCTLTIPIQPPNHPAAQAKPKVAEYPFTTLHPHVGVVAFRDGASLTVADIPGLIEGAHADRGLGHEFLRHIERTRVLAYVVDVSPANGDPGGDLAALQAELALYSPALPARPSIVVANKVDAPGARAGVAKLRAATRLPVLEVSAVERTGVGPAVEALRWLLAEAARDREEKEAGVAGAGAGAAAAEGGAGAAQPAAEGGAGAAQPAAEGGRRAA